jgi:hypothetical protein
MVIVAADLDDATERMIDFLTDSFNVPVNAVLFQPFEGGLIGRTWLRPDVDSSRSAGKRSSASAASREQSRQFWEAWLPIGRGVLPDIKLPQNGPRAVWIKRSIVHRIPAVLQVWVAASEAYAEVQFDDDEPAMNAALLAALEAHKDAIEGAFGEQLEWKGHESGGLLTKRTKVVAPKVWVEDRTSPTQDGMEQLAQSARRLIDAVKPHLADVAEAAAAAGAPCASP